MRDHIETLAHTDDAAFAEAFDRWGDARVVLLGEASHGTQEFYAARAAITRRLIERHGFTALALEANWADAAQLNRFVRHLPANKVLGSACSGFPAWMWRNAQMETFLAWLRRWNQGLPEEKQVAVHGLDLRNIIPAMDFLVARLGATDAAAAERATRRFALLRDHAPTNTYSDLPDDQAASSRADIEAVLRDGLSAGTEENGARAQGVAVARLLVNAEAFYRTSFADFTTKWNLRDTHMAEAVRALLDERGTAKVVVWAHNSHVGDLTHTGYGAEGQHSVGQLIKGQHADDAVLVGFGTYSGTVAAASRPNGAMERKALPPAIAGSWEALCHDTGVPSFLLDMRTPWDEVLEARPQRMVGSVYRPDDELETCYADAVLGRQFDAWVWFDQTNALEPLGQALEPQTAPDWPWGN